MSGVQIPHPRPLSGCGVRLNWSTLNAARVAVEASHQDWWYKYVGLDGRVVGMNSFGESAPGPVLMKEFGFTAENVIEAVEDVILS